jgi:acylphosphatase
MSENVIRRHYRIVGRVQNVGFRWWTARHARVLGVVGTVRNRPDGSVEVVAAGPPEAVQRLAGLLASGPPGANVEAVEELDPPEQSHSVTFEIVG